MKVFLILSIIGLIHKTNSYASPNDLKQLAFKYAPTVIQEIGSNPDADEFTRVDYDGDWSPDNNWENLSKFSRPRTVYWNVIESESRYFITYAFFYPRDYAGWCFWVHCHENDFEGMRITVNKAGKILNLEALAHNKMSAVRNPTSLEVVIEKEGHGIYPLSLKKPQAHHKKYMPQDYQLRSLDEIWNKRHTNLFRGSFIFNGKRYPANFGGKKWIPFGIGAAKPFWSWEVWKSDLKKGEWYLNPLQRSSEKYIIHSVAESKED